MSDRRPRPERTIQPLAAIPAVESELFTLINRFCDATETQADCSRLESLLTDPAMPDAIDVYCAAMEVHGSLRWRWRTCQAGIPAIGQQRQPAPPELVRAGSAAHTWPTKQALPRPAIPGKKQAASHIRRESLTDRLLVWFNGLGTPVALAVVLQSVVTAAAIVLAVIGQIWQTNETAQPAVACGSIIGIKNAFWLSTDQPLQIGDPVVARKRLELAAGLVEIACDSGATVVLEGPARFEFLSEKTASLLRGRLTVTVSKASPEQQPAEAVAGPRFTVHTSSAVVHDLGTRFGVEVDAVGKTHVHVFDGLIECVGRGLGTAPVARLAAGQGATVDQRGAVLRLAEPRPEPFAQTLSSVAEIRWDESRAVTVYRDSLVGAEPLAGTVSSSRGGSGDSPWTAPAANWRLTNAGLEATSPGSASLPFVPQSGRVYRLALEMTVTQGENDWAAVGFSGPADQGSSILDCAWMLQRHSTDLDPNAIFLGSDRKSLRYSAGDRTTGRRTLVIFLDTTRPRWTVTFEADGRRLKTNLVPTAARIASVALACNGSAKVLFSSFSLSFMESRHGSRN